MGFGQVVMTYELGLCSYEVKEKIKPSPWVGTRGVVAETRKWVEMMCYPRVFFLWSGLEKSKWGFLACARDELGFQPTSVHLVFGPIPGGLSYNRPFLYTPFLPLWHAFLLSAPSVSVGPMTDRHGRRKTQRQWCFSSGLAPSSRV